MIVIQQEDEQFYGGYVYTCDDSEIKMIYLTYYDLGVKSTF